MAKELFIGGNEYYFVDEDTGEIFKVNVEKQIHPTAEIVAQAIKQVHELKKAKGE
jgi:hypothetical protein